MMPGQRPPDAVLVHDVHYRWPGRRADRTLALRGTSLTIAQGEYTVLLGPNGSGKSSLFSLLVGLRVPSEGSVSVLGMPPISARRRLGMVFQQPALDRHLSVLENLTLQAGLFGFRGSDLRQRIERRAEDLELAGVMHRRVGTLSGGEQRRADLARALLHEPQVLLLDEATVGLDPAARAQFLTALEREHAARNMTVLSATHLTDEADRAQRVILMHHGKIIADAPPAALRRELGLRRVTVHDEAFAPHAGTADEWVRHTDTLWSRALHPDHAAQTLEPLVAGGISFTVAPPTLADVFLTRTGDALAADHTAPPPTHGARRT